MTDLKRNVDSVLNLMRDISGSIEEGLGFDTLLGLIAESAVKDSNAEGAAVLTSADGREIVVKRAAGDFPVVPGASVRVEDADRLIASLSPGRRPACSDRARVHAWVSGHPVGYRLSSTGPRCCGVPTYELSRHADGDHW